MALSKKRAKARDASSTREKARQLHQIIELKFGSAVDLVDAVDPYTTIRDGTRFFEIMNWLRDDSRMQFDFLRGVTGVDYPDSGHIASVYHLYSYPLRHAHVVKFLADREQPEVPTVIPLWPTANWFERESYDLLGIQYLGHPDLRRLLLPDDWVGHPLRKDYSEEQTYHGIGTTRASPLDAFAAMDQTRREAREARGDEVPDPIKSNIVAPDAPAEQEGASA